MSADVLAWLIQELSLPSLEDAEDGGLPSRDETLPDELSRAAARLAGLPGDDPSVRALIDRARRGERDVLETDAGRLAAWSVGPGRARVVFAPRSRSGSATEATERAAGVTHEVANALTAIAGWARMAATSGPLPDRTRHALEVVQRSAREALATARELLTTMRDAARPTIPPGAPDPTPLTEIVGEVLETLRPELDRAGVRLETDLTAEVLGTTPAPALRLIVSNLVKNALEALHEGGHVRVSLHVEGEQVRLTVADDGPGMSDATLAQAFDRYFTTKERGTGLGLALIAEAVHEAGGRLETESRRGVGTRFDVWLPVTGERTTSLLPPPRRTSGVHPRPLLDDKAVLVVDDDAAMRALVCTSLELQGAQVRTAAGTEEALALKGPFVLALIDLSLGHDRGDALLARLRAAGRVDRAILITGSPDADLDPLGAPDVVLRKPFELEELHRTIDAVLEAPALEAEG